VTTPATFHILVMIDLRHVFHLCRDSESSIPNALKLNVTEGAKAPAERQETRKR
jgi:hypothetical protein